MMSKRELREMLLRLLPYIAGEKQMTALFTVVLLLLTHADFDAPHIHIEPVPEAPTAFITVSATNTASGMLTTNWPVGEFDKRGLYGMSPDDNHTDIIVSDAGYRRSISADSGATAATTSGMEFLKSLGVPLPFVGPDV